MSIFVVLWPNENDIYFAEIFTFIGLFSHWNLEKKHWNNDSDENIKLYWFLYKKNKKNTQFKTVMMCVEWTILYE
jgi:hypothetical protein